MPRPRYRSQTQPVKLRQLGNKTPPDDPKEKGIRAHLRNADALREMKAVEQRMAYWRKKSHPFIDIGGLPYCNWCGLERDEGRHG